MQDKAERFEWLEMPAAPVVHADPRGPRVPTVTGRRCAVCGWLDPRSRPTCFRCGTTYGGRGRKFFEEEGIELPETTVEIDPDYRAIIEGSPERDLEVHRLYLDSAAHCGIPGFERLLALDRVEIIHYEHQIAAAKQALGRMRGQALLADEVGLGKTVEAGLAMKELIVRGLAQSVMILTPASVVGQWRNEMKEKFSEDFVIARDPDDWEGNRVLASLSTAQSARNARRILNRRFDLLIVDEAHKLRNRNTQRFQLINSIRKKYVLLLTATPVHNDLSELYSLLTILKPGILGTIRNFRKNHVSGPDARVPADPSALKEVLDEVMIRNRRDTVGIDLPDRRAAIFHLVFDPPEQRLYDEVTRYIHDELWTGASERVRVLTLVTLQREATSSPEAVRRTLENMAARDDATGAGRKRLRALAALAEGIPETTRKVRAVFEILDQFPGKFIIYTDFLGTMETLGKALRDRGETVEFFHGGLDSRGARDRVLEKFRDEARILVSTQSGGEGLNLQFCHQMINFDLPWNPMKIEQRIGRIHRLGQENVSMIFNLSLEGTIEARVLELLSQKIRMFELVIGELDLILGEMGANRSFEQLVRDIWKASGPEEALDDGCERLGERVSRARRRVHSIRDSSKMLDDVLES